MTTALHDREVARRFDALAGRFKDAAAIDDFRLLAVLDALAGLETPAVLDLGCGKGRFARRLERAGARVVGVDLSRTMLRDASGLDRVCATARRLPFADGAFSAVVAIESIEHVGPVDDVLGEARRVLRPGGRLIVIDKNAWALDARRPWLPASVVKWIDERRGLWMYPAGGAVRERWFRPRALGRAMERHFDVVAIHRLLSPAEARRAIFRAAPWARLMACWVGFVNGGNA